MDESDNNQSNHVPEDSEKALDGLSEEDTADKRSNESGNSTPNPAPNEATNEKKITPANNPKGKTPMGNLGSAKAPPLIEEAIRNSKLASALSGIVKGWKAFSNSKFGQCIKGACKYISTFGRRVREYAKENPGKMALFVAAGVCMIVLPCVIPAILGAAGFGAGGIVAGKAYLSPANLSMV